MSTRLVNSLATALLLATAGIAATAPVHATGIAAAPTPDGIMKVVSAYPFDETVARLRADIAAKGITFFMAVEQSKLAADAGIQLRRQVLLVFGNPALGAQFLTSNPAAGLDWPVRLLVGEDENGRVWAAYTDFRHIARRHQIEDREAAFNMASEVIASITSAVAAR
jgi:uncharacterized protein (DUF302 family)